MHHKIDFLADSNACVSPYFLQVQFTQRPCGGGVGESSLFWGDFALITVFTVYIY